MVWWCRPRTTPQSTATEQAGAAWGLHGVLCGRAGQHTCPAVLYGVGLGGCDRLWVGTSAQCRPSLRGQLQALRQGQGDRLALAAAHVASPGSCFRLQVARLIRPCCVNQSRTHLVCQWYLPRPWWHRLACVAPVAVQVLCCVESNSGSKAVRICCNSLCGWQCQDLGGVLRSGTDWTRMCYAAPASAFLWLHGPLHLAAAAASLAQSARTCGLLRIMPACSPC